MHRISKLRASLINHASFSWFFASLFFLFLFSVPTIAGAEKIDSFTTDIVINRETDFNVTEAIAYTFTEEKHGIYRCIPTLHHEQPSSFLKERYVDIAIHAVTMDGGAVPYEVTENADLCIKIGNPNETITGTHTYTISYTVAGAISYEKNGGAELYWNVTGNKWEVPMDSVSVRVSSPDGILMRERACYRGRVGETASCETVRSDGEVSVFAGRNLAPGEGLTIAHALNRTIIDVDIRERLKTFFVILLVLGLGIPAVVYALYRYKTAFRTDRTIIPQYEPYPEVKPMYAGYLFDKRLDPRDITAGIVYLAREGFLRIRKTEAKVLFVFEVDDYEMSLLRPMTDTRDIFEQKILELVFGNDADVGKKVSLRDLKDNYSVAIKNAKLIQELRQGLRDDMKERGLYAGFSFSSLFSKTTVAIFAGIGFLIALLSEAAVIMYVVIGFFALIALLDGRRTRKGYEALDHLRGFKDFLSVTEKDRYIFHNAPAINAEQFMEYLPYAIAFGVEKQWAKTFEGITIPNPEWYEGGTGVQTFNAVSLSQSLGSFSTAFASSSAGSASSGGGHSGGGSGGGGGGSW